jgi:hypothetical protein
MAIPSFFKQNKPKGFNYIPRYYDPAKEEMEQRRRALGLDPDAAQGDRRGNENPGEDPSGNQPGRPYRSKIMRGDMKNYFHRRQDKVRKQTTIRLLVIIIIIVLIVYLYLRF